MGQVDFKGNAKAFARTYGFLAAILPYSNADWEKLSIFLNFLIPKLPAPEGTGSVKGDPRSHRHGQLPRRGPGSHDHRAAGYRRGSRTGAHLGRRAQAGAGTRSAEQHLKTFNEMFATSNGRTRTRSRRSSRRSSGEGVRRQGLPERHEEFDKQNARIEHDKALERAVIELLSDHTELFKQFSDNASFRKWLSETIFASTYAAAS